MHDRPLRSRKVDGGAAARPNIQSPAYLPHFLRVVNVDIIGPDSQVIQGF